MALKFGLTLANCEGVVDEDYTHETKVIMMNTNTQEAIRIYDRDRIAQAEVVKYEQMKLMETYDKPEQKSDRIGGFGSTGRS
jgi:dUTP pyrophosphatase